MNDDLERAFSLDLQRRTVRPARVCAVLGIGAFASYALLDLAVVVGPVALHLLTRSIIISVLAVLLALTFTRRGQQRALSLAIVICLVIGGGVIAMTVLTGGASSGYHQALLLTFLGFSIIVPCHAWVAGAAFGALTVAYPLALWATATTEPMVQFVSNNFIVAAGAIIGTVGVYVAHRLRRAQFIARHRLARANDELRQLDQVKTRFFTNISHELRTPLTLILAPLEGLLTKEALSEAADRGELEMIHRNGLRLLKQINELLDLSRLDAKKEKLLLEDTELPPFLEGLLDSCRGLAEKRGVALEFRLSEQIPTVPIDRQKVEQVFLNLVTNALKFAGDTRSSKPRITVRAGVRQRRCYFSVEDTGPGIPKAQLGQIFERFQQADSPISTEHGGTGIGLALVKELTDLHMGEVGVTSIVGEGTTFGVELPLDREVYPTERLDRRRRQVPVAVDRRKGEELARIKGIISDPASLALAELETVERVSEDVERGDKRPLVLVVDDNRDMLNYVSMLLASDYRVRTAEDGEQGFRVAMQQPPELVITDVMMPRRNGQELLQDLRADERTRSVPVIMVTAKAEVDAKVLGLDAGADDYLTKPFNSQELRARVRSLLARRSMEAELERKNQQLQAVNFDLLLAQKDVFLQTIQALATVVEAKDPYTHGHSRRVSVLCERLAQALVSDEAEYERIRVAAVLHDIGKIGVPEVILNKPDRLTEEEWEIVKLHPGIGYRILESVQALSHVRLAIRHHHERYDGSGYPEGLAGDRIPLASRVIAVVDTYDAMTGDRSYRKGLAHDVAVAEIERCAGQQFDPQVTRAFVDLVGDRPPDIPEVSSVFSDIEPLRRGASRSDLRPVAG